MRERRKFCKKRGGKFARRREEIEGEAGKNEHRRNYGSLAEITKINQKNVKISSIFFHNPVEGEERVA